MVLFTPRWCLICDSKAEDTRRKIIRSISISDLSHIELEPGLRKVWPIIWFCLDVFFDYRSNVSHVMGSIHIDLPGYSWSSRPSLATYYKAGNHGKYMSQFSYCHTRSYLTRHAQLLDRKEPLTVGELSCLNGKANNLRIFCCSMRKLARACGVPVGRCSGGRLAMTLVATINVIIFSFLFSFFFSPSSTFLIEGVLGSKILFRESWQERPKT